MTCCATYRRIVSGEAEGLGAGLARAALGVLSVPYGWGASIAEVVKSGQGGEFVGLPTISVGNLTCGGTGKTPVVGRLVADLVARGRRPVVLSRGYASGDDGVNDEGRMLARQMAARGHGDVMHLQGRDRLDLARHAASARLGDVLVLDDGFQHQRVGRHLNVCCIDATNPWGYDSVLPRGLLREPKSSLYRARPVLITRTELVSEARVAELRAEVLSIHEHARIVESRMEATGTTALSGGDPAPVSSLRGKRVLAVSGIGNPRAFERTIGRVGGRLAGHVERGDHHDWDEGDVADVAAEAVRRAAEVIVTTEKDAVKLVLLDLPASLPAVRALCIEAVITDAHGGSDLWCELVDEALKRGDAG